MEGGESPRQTRRGPAPFASFDHDNSDESSPETKQSFHLPEIREDTTCSPTNVVEETEGPKEEVAEDNGDEGGLSVSVVGRARSQSTPGALGAAPRIDISRASSSSHQDSRDSSPELALFSGNDTKGQRLELAFREEGAADLRSSTEELAFLEGATGGVGGGTAAAGSTAPRRHSRKDSQGSEAALLAVSGRTSRLSSVGSQCSAHSALSALSRVSRLSVVSATSRSPSPHKMLLETSFCGPKPIETDPEVCAAAVEERLLEVVRRKSEPPRPTKALADSRDRREVRTEVTVEAPSSRNVPQVATPASTVPVSTTIPASVSISVTTTTPALVTTPVISTPGEEKRQKENRNRARVEERKARPRTRRELSEPEVYKTRNRSKDVIRIKLKPDEEYGDGDDDDDVDIEAPVTAVTVVAEVRKPVTLALERSPSPARRRSPSPLTSVSRKSSFCSLFKSRETIASPESPSNAIQRKRSVDSRARSKSRDRSTTPTSNKIKGSVLSLFKTSRRSNASPSPSSRDGSPIIQVTTHEKPKQSTEKLKYYEDTQAAIIHIPLRTPPEERPGSSGTVRAEVRTETVRDPVRPASAPQPARINQHSSRSTPPPKPITRTVLPDGSIIIPLHSPTEKTKPDIPETPVSQTSQTFVRSDSDTGTGTKVSAATSIASVEQRVSSAELHQTTDTPVETPITPAETPITDERRKKKERLIFSTHVGSRDQVFSTQFSITKTPSVTSEISESVPSIQDGLATPPVTLRDTHIGGATSDHSIARAVSPGVISRSSGETKIETGETRESEANTSGSETSEIGSEAERRGLVVQESFEEELPYVPTTLPQERSLALPMVPVRERGTVPVTSVRRPRAPAPPALPARPPPPPPAPPAPPASAADKLRIKLPRRPRAASASAPSTRPSRARTRTGSGGEAMGMITSQTTQTKQEWIDFEEVPERRRQPKRIQTLPPSRDLVFNYVEPDQCRCECHTHRQDASEDQQPLLAQGLELRASGGSPEGAGGEAVTSLPFTADLQLTLVNTTPHQRMSPSSSGSRRQ